MMLGWLVVCCAVGAKRSAAWSVETPLADAVVVRGALEPAAQRKLYQGLCRAASGSVEERRLKAGTSDPSRPRPLAVYQHPFTGESNTRSNPEPLFAWARATAERAAGVVPESRLGAATGYDSMVSLLYGPGATLPAHVDNDLEGLGLALSLGAGCSFGLGPLELRLGSGDALFADFGRLEHAVLEIHGLETAPAWWRHLPSTSSKPGEAATFGCLRCSLQLRRRRRSTLYNNPAPPPAPTTNR